uniref:Uncharacterized protein n=1 Tax=Arundo donax TaxID=35708 RepID=A0A0A9C7V9_ARUDO
MVITATSDSHSFNACSYYHSTSMLIIGEGISKNIPC